MNDPAQTLADFFQKSGPLAKVTVTEAHGSTPRDENAWILVSATTIFGTIGGGRLEQLAIENARAFLSGKKAEEEMNIPLGPDIGQCCGGRVKLTLEMITIATKDRMVEELRVEAASWPHVIIFGHGHVGKALAEALAGLPLNVQIVETRRDYCPKFAAYSTSLLAVPEEAVDEAPPNSAFVVMTHDHGLDFLIASRALARDDATYVGLIGSRTKRKMFESQYRIEVGDETALERLVCPIGGGRSESKQPEVIAALVAAEVIGVLL